MGFGSTERTVNVTDTEAPAVELDEWLSIVKDGSQIPVEYKFELVPFGKLDVDYHESVLDDADMPSGVRKLGYQRRQDKYARKMRAVGFNPDLFGVLIVNQRNGHYAVVDGGTRYRYLASTGLPDHVLVPCLVFGWDARREIRNYIDLNRERSGLTAVDFFVARVKVGDETAVAIDEILRVQTGQGIQPTKGAWQAVNAIETAYRRGNLEDTVSLIRELGWLDKPRGRTQAIIAAVSRVLAAPNFERTQAVKTWKGVTPGELYAWSEDLKSSATFVAQGSRSMGRLVGISLVKLYNKGIRRQGAKLDVTMFIPQLSDGDDDD